MIQGNQAWLNELAAQQKQPLYLLEIPGLGLLISSFEPTAPAANVSTTGGYGIGGYGINLYGS